MVRTFRRFLSPAGPVAYALDDQGALTHLHLSGEGAPIEVMLECEGYIPLAAGGPARKVESQIIEFLCGSRTSFDLPIGMRGTAFQRKVWSVLQQIPYGETRSIGEVAKMTGHPTAKRAVQMAARVNPVRLVIPSHRVVSDAGDDVSELQRKLIDLERGGEFALNMPQATGSIEGDMALGYLL
jgi:methylated-DNA-[protein]-cysteine S-methyltransferase